MQGRFTNRVENYMKYRPGYPQAIIELLERECNLTTASLIADVGSGTGRLTELFLNHGNRVSGIEPDSEMRVAAEYLLGKNPRFTSVAATAEATTLEDHSVDFVIAGQAFHWFEREQAKNEFLRILVPGGWVVLVWNRQPTAGTPFLTALERFWQTYLTHEGLQGAGRLQDFDALPKQANVVNAWRGDPQRMHRELIEPFFWPGTWKQAHFANPQSYDFAALKGRVWSAAIAPDEGHPYYAEMLADLTAIFQQYQVNGTVTVAYETEVFYGRLVASARSQLSSSLR